MDGYYTIGFQWTCPYCSSSCDNEEGFEHALDKRHNLAYQCHSCWGFVVLDITPKVTFDVKIKQVAGEAEETESRLKRKDGIPVPF